MTQADDGSGHRTSTGEGRGIETTGQHHNETPETSSARPVATDATAVVRFRIGGRLRFLSHAETLRVLERACIRAEMPIKYSQGFNPHPRLSLPLPRTVGVAADSELLAVKLLAPEGLALDAPGAPTGTAQANRMKEALAGTLPDEIAVESVDLVKSNTSFRPSLADYVFGIRPEGRPATIDRVRARIADVLGHERLIVERKKPNQQEGRRIDVRPFLKSIRLEDSQIVVECNISNAGSIRVDEIMTLLELTPADLDGPIRRTNVVWEMT